MMLLKNIQQKGRTGMLLVAACILAAFACNKTVVNDLPTSYPADGNGVESQNRKVLYLILDGAEGQQIDTLAPANISSLLKTSVYTWIGMSGANNKDTVLPGAWASMMTGYNTEKTKVELGFDTANLEDFPSITTRLKSAAPGLRTAGYSSSKLFDEYLLSDATEKKLSEGDDAAVAANVINNLKNDSAGLIIGQFHSIAQAGDKFGYRHNIPEYAKAVASVDGYIGQILAAMKARPNYKNENWLIVLASNENGKLDKNDGGDSTSAYNDTRRNSFIIYNNPRFIAENIGRDGTPSTKGLSAYNDSALLLTGSGSNGVSVSIPQNDMYSVKEGQGGTVEFKFKILDLTLKGSGYLNLVANGGGFVTNPNGFSVWVDGNTIKFFMGDNAHYINSNSAAQIKDGNWHTVCFAYDYPKGSGKLYANLYIDGVLDRGDLSCDITEIIPKKPITIGCSPGQSGAGNYTNYLVTDFRFWNTQLPSDVIALYNCQNEISSTSPYIGNLMASYRLNDGNGSTVIKDKSANQLDAEILDPSKLASWQTFNDVSNSICPAPDQNFYKATPNGLDIPMQIYQWLGVVIDPVWNLEGQYWTNGYTDVQLPDNY